MRVNLSIRLGGNVVITLFSDVFGCEMTRRPGNRFDIAVSEGGELASLLDYETLKSPCRLEFPDRAIKSGVVESVVEVRNGMVLEGRFI